MDKKEAKIKRIRSRAYNYDFDYRTGAFARWGKTIDDDPILAPFGPEILDIEVSTICSGVTGKKPCSWCYKSNTAVGDNMSLQTFKSIFDKIPRSLTQIAFGIGDIDGNPDLFEMFRYCRENEANMVIPNVTINGHGLTDDFANKLGNLCGAVSVSRYSPKDVCYNAVQTLTEKGLKQCNIHMLFAEETYQDCLQLISDSASDSRLKGLNCIVFLMLKPKGKRNKYNVITDYSKIEKVMNLAMETNAKVGMDSCSAPSYLKVAQANDSKDHPFSGVIPMIEPCESTLFSLYVDVKGNAYPCSFTEGEPGWETGIPVAQCEDFLRDVWFNERIKVWRDGLIGSSQKCECDLKIHCRSCPQFPITHCKDFK